MSELNQGLTSKEVKQNRNNHGENTLTITLGLSLFKRLIRALLSSSQIVLLLTIIINCIYGYMNEYITYALIGIYGIRALLSILFNGRKSISYSSLMKSNVQVVRDGKPTEVSLKELVVGDLMYVKQNDYVGADGIIRETKQLALKESIYNSKNKYVTKQVGDLVYLGSNVLFGSAIVEVTSVGNKTILGKCTQAKYSPLAKKVTIQKAVNWITCIFMVLVVGGIVYTLKDNMVFTKETIEAPLKEAFGLLMVLGLNPTLLVADYFGCHEESKLKKQLMKQSSDHYIDELSQVDLLILDKKETFTKQELEVVQSYADDQDLIGLGLGLYAKDHIDQYKHAFAKFAGEEKFNIEALMDNMNLVQSSTNKSFDHIVSNLYVADRGFILYSIGSVDDLLDVSKYIYLDGQEVFFGAREREVIGRQCAAMNALGQEVLGIAYQVRKSHVENMDELTELCFIGLIGLQNPLKVGCLEGLKLLNKEKVQVMMMSDERSDLVGIAAKDAGIIHSDEEILTGSQLETMTERRLLTDLENYKVFVNLSGSQKERVITALKKKYNKIAVSIRSIEEIRSITSADVLLTGSDCTPEFASPLGDIQLKNLDLKTINEGITESRKDLQRFYRIMNYCLSLFVGFALVYLFGFACNSGLQKGVELFDGYRLIGVFVGMSLLALVNTSYSSKKRNVNTASKLVLVSLLEGLVVGCIGILMYLCTWYFKQNNVYFELGMILITLLMSIPDNHMKKGYSFHVVPFLLRVILLLAVIYYYVMVLKNVEFTVNAGIFVGLSIAVLLIVSVIKKLVYRKENRYGK